MRTIYFLLFSLVILPSENVRAQSLRQGCKAIILVATQYETEFTLLKSTVGLTEGLIKKGCKPSDIHVVFNPKINTSGADLVAIPQSIMMKRALDKSGIHKYESSKAGIEKAFGEVQKTIKANDRLLVVISGHSASGKKASFPGYFLSATDLKGYLSRIDSKYPNGILKSVVADFCFSGAFVKPLSDKRTCVASSQESDALSMYSKKGYSYSVSLSEGLERSRTFKEAVDYADSSDSSENIGWVTGGIKTTEAYGAREGEGFIGLIEVVKLSFTEPCKDFCQRTCSPKRNVNEAMACEVSCASEKTQFQNKMKSYMAHHDQLERTVVKNVDKYFASESRRFDPALERRREDEKILRAKLNVERDNFLSWISQSRQGQKSLPVQAVSKLRRDANLCLNGEF